MRHLILQLSLILFFTNLLFGQSSKRPEGIVIPVSTIGNVSEVRRKILENTLIENLSKYYNLVSQDKLQDVQEKVFQELDYEECTESKCIIRIQEILQIDNLFLLEVISEGQDTQLSLKWFDLYNNKIRTNICENCGTLDLNERIENIVKELIENEIPKSENYSDDSKRKTLYYRKNNGTIGWYKTGDKNSDIRFEGIVKNGIPEEYGVIYYPNEKKYIGKISNGEPYGEGTLIWEDGSKYIGQFMNGEQNGVGQYTYSNGELSGNWKDGFLEGTGIWTTYDGGEYVGEFKKGLRHGEGVHKRPDGSIYKGNWKNNKEHGQGVWDSPKGKGFVRFKGEFKNGLPWNLNLLTKRGSVTGKVIKGKLYQLIDGKLYPSN